MLSHNTRHANKTKTKMQASASAAPQATTIHDEESPMMGEVSDVVDDDTTVVDNLSRPINWSGGLKCYYSSSFTLLRYSVFIVDTVL